MNKRILTGEKSLTHLIKYKLEDYPDRTFYCNYDDWERYEIFYKIHTTYKIPEDILDEIYGLGYDAGRHEEDEDT